MKVGQYSLRTINFGFFRLDGGAMFGSVPKNLWSKKLPVDDENCIKLATRCLLLEDETRKILIDVGNGDKWNQKLQTIFAIDNIPQEQWGFYPEEITDLVITHLHFDHAGGISYFDENGTLKPTFPNATVHLQLDNYENSKNPTVREKASYLPENITVLADHKELFLIDGKAEILPNIWVHPCHGHTRGQQWIEIKGAEQPIFFPTDVVPTSAHLPLPYSMGYDIWTEQLLKEKDEMLSRAVDENAIVIFEHDPQIEAATIAKDKKGHYCIKEQIPI